MTGREQDMEAAKLSAQIRDTHGKSAARRLRANHLIPAVAYGRGMQSIPLTVSPKDLHKIFEGELGRNAVIRIDVEGKESFLTLLVEHQAHPVTRALLHADFLKIDEQVEVEVEVPLVLSGKAKGVTMGGELLQVFRELPVRCLPAKIPAAIHHDITELGLEETVSVGDLVRPEGISIRLPDSRTVAGIFGAKRRGGEEEAAEGAEAAAGDAAAAAKKEPAKK